MRRGRAFRRAKEPGRPCEDMVLCWSREGRLAVSDGASVSYDSRKWAWSLCRTFIRNTNFGIDWLSSARAQFADRFGPPADDWAASHAWDRGSFATFLGITLTQERLVAHGVGDTILFVVAGSKIQIWPEVEADDFSASPALLCSHPGRSAFNDTESAFDKATQIVDAPTGGWGGTRLIVATDALAEWVIRAVTPDERLSRLDSISSHVDHAEFAGWVSDAISAGDVRRDDCAVVVVEL
jgi:hypothetical protein